MKNTLCVLAGMGSRVRYPQLSELWALSSAICPKGTISDIVPRALSQYQVRETDGRVPRTLPLAQACSEHEVGFRF